MELKIDKDLNVEVLLNHTNTTLIKQEAVTEISADSTVSEDGESTDMGEDTYSEVPMDASGIAVKEPLLSNWAFIIGITAVTFTLSIVVGILLAKRKIKKGLEPYED